MSENVLKSGSDSLTEPVEGSMDTGESINISKSEIELGKELETANENNPTTFKSTTATADHDIHNKEVKDDSSQLPIMDDTQTSNSLLNTKQTNKITSDVILIVSESDREQKYDIHTATVKTVLNEDVKVDSCNLPLTDVNILKKSDTDMETKSDDIEINSNSSPLGVVKLEINDSGDLNIPEMSKATEVNQKRGCPGDGDSEHITLSSDEEQPAKQRKLCGDSDLTLLKRENILEVTKSEPSDEDIHVTGEDSPGIPRTDITGEDSLGIPHMDITGEDSLGIPQTDITGEDHLGIPHTDITGEDSPKISHTELLDSTQVEVNTLVSRDLNFDKPPVEISRCQSEFFEQDNCLKGCKWSPDGSCLLTCSNDCSLRLFNLPPPLLHGQTENLEDMCSVLRMKEGETIYDYAWYPLMSSNDPATCCLVSTSGNTPVHMWDAFTGELRCSYRAFNQVDEVTPAYSLAFNKDGSKLLTGFNKMIRVFDVTRPGRNCQQRPTYVKEGQSGIISCIVPSPSQPNLYAAGSYARSVALYSDSDGEMVCMFEGHQGGVTHLQFTPDGSKLLSGGRKDPEILCWDLRYPGQILFTVQRDVLTNQRIYFDIDWSGRYLVSGNHDGTVRVWDMSQPITESSNGSDPVLKPTLSYHAHSDCINGVSFHPSMPLLATSSGQRHFNDLSTESDEETEELSKVDNSVKLWCAT